MLPGVSSVRDQASAVKGRVLPFLFCLIVFFILGPLRSCNTGEVIASEKDLRKKYERIQREIKRRKSAIEKTIHKERSLLEEIEKVNRELDTLKVQIKRYRREISGLRKQLYRLRKEMSNVSERLAVTQRWLKRRLVAMQKYGMPIVPGLKGQESASLLLYLMSQDTSEFIRRWYYLKRLAEYEYSLINEYEKGLHTLRAQEEEKRRILISLKSRQRDLIKKESELREKKKEKRQLLASIRKERQLYKKMLSELKESSRRLRELIIESEKQRYVLKGFSKMKRKLSWPVKGTLALPYGSYIDPKYKTPVFRNGIHIKAKEGEIVRAVYTGKVVYADWFKGYGRVVIINHGEGYYTVYANLSEIFLSKGDIIKRGAPVGRVGESGTLNAPGLYFEVRYKGKPLNPLHWLKRRG